MEHRLTRRLPTSLHIYISRAEGLDSWLVLTMLLALLGKLLLKPWLYVDDVGKVFVAKDVKT